jgi:hypoxanthine phosphoribosyltransferase
VSNIHTVGSILIDAKAIGERVRELGRRITSDYRGKTPHVVAILKGACLFHADLIREIELDLTVDFIAVGSYGASTASSGEVRLLKDLEQSIGGRDVLLVEDILDTGITLNYLLRILSSRGPGSLKVAALLSKPSRRKIDVPADYVGFEIPDAFVVGYGLDFEERYRNLPDIRRLGCG